MTTCHLTKVELQRFFEVFDEDNSGGIGPDELCEAFLSLGWDNVNPTHCEHMIKEQFGQHVSEINFEQFQELVDCVQMPTDSLEECTKAFQYFDKSGIGKICIADLKEAGRIATGKEVPDSLIRQIMQAVDTNKDGYIQLSEFHKAVVKVGIREDPSEIFEKEAGLGVGFGGSTYASDLGTAAEQRQLLAVLAGQNSVSGFGANSFNNSGRHATVDELLNYENDDPTVENDPDYDPEAGVTLGQTANATMAMSMTFNGRMIRTKNYKSQHWDVRPHITPSQRADMDAIESRERAQRFRLEGMAEDAFNDEVLTPHIDGIIAEEERVAAVQRAIVEKKEAEKAAAEAEKAAKAAAAAEKKAALAAAKAEKAAERADKKILGPKPSAAKPPVATPRSGAAGASTSSATAAAAARSSASPEPNRASSATKSAASTASTAKKAPAPVTAKPRKIAPGLNSTAIVDSRRGSPSPASPTSLSSSAVPAASPAKKNVAFDVNGDDDDDDDYNEQFPPTSATAPPLPAAAGGGDVQTLVICKQPVTFVNGLIAKAEVRKMMVHYYEDVTDEDFDMIFEDGDKDGDGFLTVYDYKNFLEMLGYMDF